MAIVNDTKYNNNLFIAILYDGTDYFVKDIKITSLFQLLLRFQKNFYSFFRELI